MDPLFLVVVGGGGEGRQDQLTVDIKADEYCGQSLPTYGGGQIPFYDAHFH